MCISMAVVAAVTVVAGGIKAASSISAANAQKKSARYEMDLQNKQRTERARVERLQAIEQENARRSEFNSMRSSAFAAIGASGLSDNITFFQGADPEQQSAFLRDVRNIRLGLAVSESSLKDDIQAAGFGYKIAKFNTKQTKIGAVAEFAKTAMTAANMYGQGGTPAKAGG